MRDKDDWLVERSLGRFDFLDWRGCLAFLTLMLVGVVGMGVESACRPNHPILEVVLMVPLGVLFLGLAWTISSRTRRGGERRK